MAAEGRLVQGVARWLSRRRATNFTLFAPVLDRKTGISRIRTVGTYQVFHDGVAVDGLKGAIFEQKGPGNNGKKGQDQDLCVEAGRYPLATQDGTKYKTIKYKKTAEAKTTFGIRPRPGIELLKTGKRSEILIHPAQGFLSSEGCVHRSKPLAQGTDPINYAESRRRVIAIIDDMHPSWAKVSQEGRGDDPECIRRD